MKADIVLINPGDRKQVFQGLGQDLAAIEPPFWVAVLGAYLRQKGFSVVIIDSNAENISPKETADRTASYSPLLAALIVYGSQPSASTQNMSISGKILKELSAKNSFKVAVGGLHPSALPEKTLTSETLDFVIDGEGPLTLEKLLVLLKEGKDDWTSIPGLWWKEDGKVRHTERAPLIDDLDKYLPTAAWDLLPMQVYRAHNWHCFDEIEHRQPYGAIYTSLGCPFNCVFCCINAPFGKPGIRYRSTDAVLDEIKVLVEKYHVKNLKIIDELFVLKESHYIPICEGIIRNGWDLNIWCYARVDTVKESNLALMKKAGINWLALGIESADPKVRDGASKQMRVNDIKRIVSLIREHEIRVIGNYIFGLPDDDQTSMQATLDMAMELNCEFANFYSSMAYPGSKLYELAVKNKWELPDCWHGFSQHSYECKPLPTKHVSAREVLKFRDDAFHKYFENPAYLKMLENTFGKAVADHIREISKSRLKRKILES